jgi:peptide-methionine (R)-S-oxide reductase
MKYKMFLLGLVSLSMAQCQTTVTNYDHHNNQKEEKMKLEKDAKLMTPEDWKKTLTAEQYDILREKGTERAFTGKYWNHKEKGQYYCA